MLLVVVVESSKLAISEANDAERSLNAPLIADAIAVPAVWSLPEVDSRAIILSS